MMYHVRNFLGGVVMRAIGMWVAVAAVVGVLGRAGAEVEVPRSWPVGTVEAMLSREDDGRKATGETERIVKELTAEAFEVRERATEELKRRGVWEFPGLAEKVAGLGDEELRARVEAAGRASQFHVPAGVPRGRGCW